MSNPETLKTRLEAMIRFIEAASEKARAGTVAGLGALEGDIGALCADVKQADPATAKEVQPLMAEMIARLDELEQNLRVLKDKAEARA